MYDRLNWSHEFGAFLGQKFNTMKRFGLEGCESFIPGLKVAIDAAVDEGATQLCLSAGLARGATSRTRTPSGATDRTYGPLPSPPAGIRARPP